MHSFTMVQDLNLIIIVGIFVACGITYRVRGPTVWVRRGLALGLALQIELMMLAGQGSALLFLLFVPFFSFAGLSSYRAPLTRNTQPLGQRLWPDHCLSTLEQWTHDLASNGFVHVADDFSTYLHQGRTKESFRRVMNHPALATCVAIGVNVTLKAYSRVLYSRTTDGRIIVTSDRPTDYESLRDDLIDPLHLETGCETSRLLNEHQRRTWTSRTPLPSDVVGFMTEVRDGWVRRIMAAGLIRLDGNLFALTARAKAITIINTYKNWLH